MKRGVKARKLVSGYLERIHSKAFSKSPDELTELVSGEHGVYALYEGNLLYDVGPRQDQVLS
jgi:hypothetical protein